MSFLIVRNEKAISWPTRLPIWRSIRPISIPSTFKFDSFPAVSFFLATFTSLPAAKNASGSKGVSLSGNSPSKSNAREMFFRNEPSPIVSFSGSLIWLSVYLAAAVSNITAFSQIASIRFR